METKEEDTLPGKTLGHGQAENAGKVGGSIGAS